MTDCWFKSIKCHNLHGYKFGREQRYFWTYLKKWTPQLWHIETVIAKSKWYWKRYFYPLTLISLLKYTLLLYFSLNRMLVLLHHCSCQRNWHVYFGNIHTTTWTCVTFKGARCLMTLFLNIPISYVQYHAIEIIKETISKFN